MKELSSQEELSLWREYKETKNPEIREQMIKQYAPLVKYVAGKVAIGMPHNVEFDDLVGYGVFGLFDAIEKFDPDKHIKFKTYAVTRIRGAIFDELRSIDWVPRSVRQKSREVEDAIRTIEASLGRAANDEEIAKELGISTRELEKIMLRIGGTSILSLNELWYSGEDSDNVSIVDTIEGSDMYTPETIVEKAEIKRVIIKSIQELPEKEKTVLVLYYYEDLTLKEIGKVLEVTESRVSQLHTKAITRLRAKLMNIKKGVF